MTQSLKPLSFAYDEARDVLTVEGMHFSGELFRAWAHGGLRLYEPFEITRREDGVVTVCRLELSMPRLRLRSNNRRWS